MGERAFTALFTAGTDVVFAFHGYPGLHLLTTGEDAGSLARIVDHEAGLLGVSGRTADVAALLALRATDRDAIDADRP